MTSLEALENIKREAGTPYFSSLYDIDDWKQDFATVRKTLMAFEILKKHLGAPFDCLKYYGTARDWNEEYGDDYPLTDDEFDLLVEVIDDERQV